jgi:hypothetical protein
MMRMRVGAGALDALPQSVRQEWHAKHAKHAAASTATFVVIVVVVVLSSFIVIIVVIIVIFFIFVVVIVIAAPRRFHRHSVDNFRYVASNRFKSQPTAAKPCFRNRIDFVERSDVFRCTPARRMIGQVRFDEIVSGVICVDSDYFRSTLRTIA